MAGLPAADGPDGGEPPADDLGRRLIGLARRGARGLVSGLVDMALPPSCPLCRSLTASVGGLCPACWGQIRFIERPYCERLGTPFPYDLGAGALSAPAIADPPVFDRLRAVAIFDGGARDLVHDLKYRDRTDLAPMMGGLMARAGRDLLADADVIVPVPLHPFRLWQRRFNQAALLGAEIGRAAGVAVLPDGLRRVRRTRRQVGLERRERLDNMRGAFALARPEAVAGRRVLLVDDVYTTGATVESVTRILRRGKAARVDVLVFARVVAAGTS
ncbi:ComF family protein [Methylobrevis pamukkalensis]